MKKKEALDLISVPTYNENILGESIYIEIYDNIIKLNQ